MSERSFQVFVKPVGPVCNLHCQYCYYLEKKELYENSHLFRMSGDLLEEYVRQQIEATTGETLFFSWHGGEPLLAGIDFYRQAVALQKRYLPLGKRLLNGIQTNGTLIDDSWSQFLSEEKFMVGISLDGTEALHDIHRQKNGKGTFGEVIRGYKNLVSHGIIPEILCVVHAQNVSFPLEIYRFFRSLGAEYITFLPLVERLHGSPSGVSPATVVPRAFGEFLTAIFDEWLEKDIGRIKVQIFEETIATAFSKDHTLCIFKEHCGGVPVVEHTGDVYSCDHFADRDHYQGNLRDHTLAWILDSPEQHTFGQMKSTSLPGYCRKCPVLEMCRGECPKNRFILTPEGEPHLNYLCEGYKLFFLHCRPFVEAVRLISVSP